MEMKLTKKIALQRIHVLFRLAKTMIHENPKIANKYVETARKIALRARVRLPIEYKRLICKHCKKFILPGFNCHVRIQPKRNSHVVVTCHMCMRHMRMPLEIQRKKV